MGPSGSFQAREILRFCVVRFFIIVLAPSERRPESAEDMSWSPQPIESGARTSVRLPAVVPTESARIFAMSASYE